MRYLYILLLILIVGVARGAGLTRYEYAGSSVYNMAKDTDTIIRKQSLSVGINYGSDAMFFGRTGPITYPFFSTDVVYNTKAGFFCVRLGVKVDRLSHIG